ncbi:hypothetical protein [Clostridium thermobutyricum]|uniref:hypothetical protein n=1 Tax=Clostridium thermobutyricum TaxID=29372 RepID=UPI0018A99FE9|nr:hypothetical protein [Clostridium thermobutyricum]
MSKELSTMNNFEKKIENYRPLKRLKTSLEYRLCQTLDPEERKVLKNKCLELKATLKIIECAVETLKDKPEYEVVYYSYIKEGWERKSVQEIAQELYLSLDFTYAKRKSGKDKVNAFLRYIYYSLVS